MYEGTSHRVSARALHNRGLIRVARQGKTWVAKITPEGSRRLAEQTQRIEAVRERERRELQAAADREREQQQLAERAAEVLEEVTAAGGRLDLGSRHSPQELERFEARLATARLLPEGQRLAHEPTRMDPDLGWTAYLDPDFAALTSARTVKAPQQLRGPHPAVAAFQDKRAYVSKPQIARAARILQTIVTAAVEIGWKISAKTPNAYNGSREVSPDLSIKLSSREILVTIHELDQRGRSGLAFTTDTDYYTRTTRTTVNRSFLAAGRLEIIVTKVWEQQTILTRRDTDGASLEDQLAALIRELEIAEAEAAWARQEESRRAKIREGRWEEVKQEAVTKLTYERNTQRLLDELDRRTAAAAMREHADQIDSRAAELAPPAREAEPGPTGFISTRTVPTLSMDRFTL